MNNDKGQIREELHFKRISEKVETGDRRNNSNAANDYKYNWIYDCHCGTCVGIGNGNKIEAILALRDFIWLDNSDIRSILECYPNIFYIKKISNNFRTINEK